MFQWFFESGPVFQGLIATLFTYFVTALGAAVVFFFKSANQKILDMMMGFAAGVMIAAAFWSLLEPAVDISEKLGLNTWLTVSAGFILGGVFVVAADIFMSKAALFQSKSPTLKRSILLATSVTLHNIPEGLAIGVAFASAAMNIEGASVIGAVMLSVGIAVQNFPEGLCVALPLRREGYSRRRSFFIGQASGFVEPVAGTLGAVFAMTARNALPLVLSFSAGAMISVACVELIPESCRGNKTIVSLGVIGGFALMMALDVALG
ncbi:MAG: ZIP family metal transporter [Oscillospiraceae bacterium]|nr:ZIP family metal transporter [Oscillospiraceae bacterium]